LVALVSDDELLLPERTRLVHIGPHKTGTTALQAALFESRQMMLDQGVRHLGKTRNPALAVRAVTGRNAATSIDTAPPMRYWRDLVAEFGRAREPRVVLSSEFFSWADAAAIRRIADDLDADRLHVVVTLRPLAKILPSQWQQDIQAGAIRAYDAWLQKVLNEQDNRVGHAFWTLHRHDELIARWAGMLGRDRVTVVVAEESDRRLVLRAFETMLGLSPGTIAPVADQSNRSLTLPEVEIVRAFNVAARKAGVTRPVHAKLMRYGAAAYMKTRVPGPDEPRIETPQWALDRAGEIAREMVAAIAASGVRVVGDLESLTVVPASGLAGDRQPAVSVPPAIAASMAMGVVVASGLARDSGRAGSVWIEPLEVARLSTWQIAAVLGRRMRGALVHTIRRAGRVARRTVTTRLGMDRAGAG
jgi:hypothetical protein